MVAETLFFLAVCGMVSYTRGSVDGASCDYWRDALQSPTELAIPKDYPIPVPYKLVETEQTFDVLPAASLAILQTSLKNTQNGEPMAPFTVLLTGFCILLHRYTGESDIIVGSSAINKNPLLIRAKVEAVKTFDEAVQDVYKVERESLRHAEGLRRYLSGLSDSESASIANLFKVRFFNQVDADQETLTTLGELSGSNGGSEFSIYIKQSPSLRRILPIQIRIVYNSLLFSASRVQIIFQQWCHIIQIMASDASATCGSVSLLESESRHLLPDPVSDLHWEGYEGAITEIFVRNAKATPDLPCVLDATRTFSYREIAEASFAFAKVLQTSLNVKQQQVVAIYACRSVDLVVAIMGVLQTGATFCVVDPAYPPQRQRVYLEISCPNVLVTLKGTPPLQESVANFVSGGSGTKGMLKSVGFDKSKRYTGSVLHFAGDSQIPTNALISDSEKVSDCFAGFRTDLCDVRPLVDIGPDDVCTLSFTSGSTGVPKGVKGRHFSLTHFYPWMKTKFLLSSEDRFTMLSGIAHDPIQRDIFTPLFLGATLYVPSADDISTPGQLAKWMAAKGITVTHLTPAMGQLLSATATDVVPSLRRSFFVGDVLTKRDVSRLQHIAPNCNVINMYGTTETQRAVSYFELPCLSQQPNYLANMKDIMPAGRGMVDVQLLLVNNQGALCGVGERGEIYMRSSGLAAGYLGLDSATNEKFVANWFLSEPESNPRDRLYKTGDLGRYTPAGEVECSGRKDDQVKIRGFRIELGEIDMCLSQHPLVRENVTLVRRDRYEEQTLVSYLVFHPELETSYPSWESELRDCCRAKLPHYAVPTVFVSLTRIPLTPNGKVDKNALPFPDTARFQARSSSPAGQLEGADQFVGSLTEQQIHKAFVKLLGVTAEDVKLDSNFFDLGGHSLLATRLIFELRQTLALEIPLQMIYREPTVRHIAKACDQLRDADLNLVDSRCPAGSAVSERESVHRARSNCDPSLPTFNYSAEVDKWDSQLQRMNIPSSGVADLTGAPPAKLVLTGATGFLGAFILRELLFKLPGATLYVLIRADDERAARKRLDTTVLNLLVFDQATWERESRRVHCLVGDISKERWGLSKERWEELAVSVDSIVHNGAFVHWVYPYDKLESANVGATVEGLKLACLARVKPFHFVSSTSVLDTGEYRNTVSSLKEGGTVFESDDISRSRELLASGYAQTKWVSEQLVQRARSRGLPCTILRPGYITGDTRSGATNTDDFIWRLVKGCLSLKRVPSISNVVNMCSVDYVASIMGAIVLLWQEATARHPTAVFHTWNHSRYRFNDLFKFMKDSYSGVIELEFTEYVQWRTHLMNHSIKQSDHALMPLLHFVLDDLPTSTKAPDLDDVNTQWLLQLYETKFGQTQLFRPPPQQDMGILMEKYFRYLIKVGYLPVIKRISEDGEIGSRMTAFKRSRH